jgi:hypothetical protein
MRPIFKLLAAPWTLASVLFRFRLQTPQVSTAYVSLLGVGVVFPFDPHTLGYFTLG